ncbi:MAG: hypothetical protein HY427_03030 [Candidatus Levybacteria bacterium]|nr:hypothetical protein [Candidatus Levybacteria bacterium]
MKKQEAQRGQMLLVVVLTMIVALTVGLSVVSRTITNLRISKQSEESQRAFQAAEAGIEKTLESGVESANPQSLGNNAQYMTSVNNPSGNALILNGNEVVEQDVGIDLWLSDYPNYSNQICPSSCAVSIHFNTIEQSCSAGSGNNTRSGLEVVVLSGVISNPTINKYLFDPCSGRTPGADNAGGRTTIDATTFQHGVSIPVTSGIIARVIPIYNSVKIGVTSSVNIPVQGRIIESIGESGETIRKVQYFSSHPQLPLEIFPYSIISQ